MTTAATAESTLALLTRFENAFNPLDVNALMSDMSEDAVFEHIAPEGAGLGRHEGHDAVRDAWESLPSVFPGFKLEVVDIFATADRGACQWTMTWRQEDGSEGFLRGCDVFRVRDGKITEKLTYTG